MVVMDPTKGFRERDLLVDLESGRTASEEEGSNYTYSSLEHAKKLLNRVSSGFTGIDGSIRGEEAMNSGSSFSNSVEVPFVNGQLLADNKLVLGEENLGLMEKKMGADKPKKKACKKAPKPPRPPKSPSLDAADQKLVREISELAMLKRARIERMKALKNVKNSKTASSKSNMCALIVTVLFCLVLIWQGLCSESSSNMSFDGSPESSVATRGGLISVQYYRNIPMTDSVGFSSASPNMIEQVSGLDSQVEATSVAG